MQICLAQANPKVGDFAGNFRLFKQVVDDYRHADLIIFPELFLTGFPPKDLLLRGDFLRGLAQTQEKIVSLSANIPGTTFVVGLPWETNEGLFNSLLVFKEGEILGVQHKRQLTNFRLFEENRYFTAGKEHLLIQIGAETLGFALGLELDAVLAQELKKQGATLIINPVAIPYQTGDYQHRLKQVQNIAFEVELPIIRVNQVGANDELIFPGGSVAVDATGGLAAYAKEFTSDTVLLDLSNAVSQLNDLEVDETEQIYRALTLGLQDYVWKNGMDKVIIGLSGGLDSAVAAAIAVNALGPEKVWGVTQPGPYSTASSVPDAEALANNLGIRFSNISISSMYQKMLDTLADYFSGTEPNVAEENIQARLRGNAIMALSNKFGGLVLTNSNKSELAVGYCTLYGDMSGGLAVLADVYKTMVYQLAYYINRKEEVIPWNTIEKPPSAELRPDQKDDDTLPPYDILDRVIELYLHGGLTPEEIIAQEGYGQEIVHWITRTIDNNEYKRRQAALVLRVTTPILGFERCMPLTAQKYFEG